MCPSCSAHNYASKTACHKCNIPKMGGGMAMAGCGGCGMGMGGCGGYGMGMPMGGCGMGMGGCGMAQQGSYGMAQNFNASQNRSAPYSAGATGDGNWTCPSCSNINFPMRTACNRCKLPKGSMGMQGMPQMQMQMPAMMAGMGMPANMRQGDWLCPACTAHNYADKTHCHKCAVPKETRLAKTGMREGDWICTACANHNFASKTDCNKCQAPKGAVASHAGQGGNGGREGDWMCPSCSNKNYAHRVVCNRCQIPKP